MLGQKTKDKRQKGKPKQFYKACHIGVESWIGSDGEIDRSIDTVVIKSFNFNSISFTMVALLEGSCS